MPRKKIIETGFHVKFIPAGSLNLLIKLADEFEYIQNSNIALMKYVETLSSIIERCWNKGVWYVPVSTRMLSKNLGLNIEQTLHIMNALVDNNLLIRSEQGFVPTASSWKYKPVYKKLDYLIIHKQYLNKKTNMVLENIINTEPLDSNTELYSTIVKKLRIDSNTLVNYVKYKLNIKINNLASLASSIQGSSLVPYTGADGSSLVLKIDSDGSRIVPCEGSSLVPYEIFEGVPELIPVVKLMGEKFRVSRPNPNSRIYTNITNLSRHYRQFLRLNGKPLKGFDIANSQPMLATIAFKNYSNRVYGYLKPDVIEYQQICEQGLFYEYFIEKLAYELFEDMCKECGTTFSTTCEECRTKFKKLFFGKVFYTKEVLKENPIKAAFKEKYPTCYEAIYDFKGGLWSDDYKKFPVSMAEEESDIIFNTNIELINMGYDVVNIFDALYSDSEEALAIAKQIIERKFSAHGIKPKFKDIDYTIEPTETEVAIVEAVETEIVYGNGIQTYQYYLDSYKDEELAREMFHYQFELAKRLKNK